MTIREPRASPTTFQAEMERIAHPLRGVASDYDALLEAIGDRRLVLIGEASHGTHEFYAERALITQRLISELGFNAVAIEGDWPDAYRVNRYVAGQTHEADAAAALGDFRRFPAWMWRNHDVVAFVEWLHAHNSSVAFPDKRVRFYGLDLYSLAASIESVIKYLDVVDPAEAAKARERYSCFDHISSDGQRYGHSVAVGVTNRCENEVVSQLIELRRRARDYLSRDGWINEDELFFAEQNAVVIRDAEEYYHQMYRAEVSSWNLRDRHMAATLDALITHLERRFDQAKVVVWEHNSHVGDARATSMGAVGELNVGQLARQRYGSEVFLIGFSTFTGRVTAASNWGDPPQRKIVRPGLQRSYELLFHRVELAAFWVLTSELSNIGAFWGPRLQRAIGVIYRPETERRSHYFEADLPRQFDAMIHIDQSSAVVPLESNAEWEAGEPPETFPSGL